MMGKLPLVSVNMPVKNGAGYIKEAIESVLNQTFSDFELIIVNDGSTDNSAEIVRSFTDRRIHFFENKKNKGIAFTRNFAIENSRGKYIAIFDCDDIMLPRKLQKQVAFLEQNPDVAMLGSSIETIDKDGIFIKNIIFTPPSELIKTRLFFGNYFAQSSMLIRKNILKDYFYDKKFLQAEDYFLWSQIAQNQKVANLEEILIKYRVHNQSISNARQEQMKEFEKKVYEFQLSLLRIFPTETELENHFLLLKNQRNIDLKNKKQVKTIYNWTIFLQNQNQKLQVFNSKLFNQCIKNRWRRIIRENYKNKNINSIEKVILKIKYNLCLKFQ